MKKMNRNEWIAVAVSLAFITYMFAGSLIVNLFNPQQAMNTQTGVQVQDLVVGQGATAEAGDNVTVHYVGTLDNGKVFDSSIDRGTPFTFTLGIGQVIKGWDVGVAGMKVGGKRKLVISPEFGYGAQTVGPIPANSALIFEVQLLDVKKAVK
ncbi:MAG: FKBP-type peptidyl-prolyl cis-trans isomerase [Minisyncoccia bacterium]